MSNVAPDPAARPGGAPAPSASASAPAAEPASARLGAGLISRYAIGSLGTGGFSTLPGLVLTYYLTDSLGVAAIMAGLVITLAKVWDVVIDPLVGALSDHELARRGSRRRMMVLGGCLLPLFFAVTFATPTAIGPVAAAIWVLVAFLLTATAFSLFQVPYIALPAELTPRYDERTRLLTWRVVVLTIAILLFGAGGPAVRDAIDDPTLGYLVMGIASGVVIAVGMLISATVARRAAVRAPTAAGRRAGDIRAHYVAAFGAVRRSGPFRALLLTYLLQALATGLMLAGAQYVATWVMHSQAAVTLLFIALIAPAIFAAPAWGVLARRIGKERGFAIASVLFGIAALSIVGLQWAPGDWVYAPVAVAGIAYAGMQSLPMAMLPDVISHDERAHGGGRAGEFSGMWTAGETVGFALGAAALSIVLAVTGYVSSTAATAVVQPAAAVTGIVLAFSIVPAVLIAVSLVTLRGYRLRRDDVDGAAAAAAGGIASQQA
jgi:glycoside/pentoside/hexuronide:cation symporter, GPH family